MLIVARTTVRHLTYVTIPELRAPYVRGVPTRSGSTNDNNRSTPTDPWSSLPLSVLPSRRYPPSSSSHNLEARRGRVPPYLYLLYSQVGQPGQVPPVDASVSQRPVCLLLC